MTFRLFALASIIALGFLWARSLSRVDDLSYAVSGQRSYSLMSYLGGVHAMTIAEHPNSGLSIKRETIASEIQQGFDRTWNTYYPAPMTQHQVLGFAYVHGWYNPNSDKNGMPPMGYRAVVIPYGFLFVCTVAATVITALRRT